MLETVSKEKKAKVEKEKVKDTPPCLKVMTADYCINFDLGKCDMCKELAVFW